MKTNKLFGLAVLACGFALSFTSCTQEDNPVTGKKTVTISFEGAALNADGYWCGDNSGVKFDYWGEDGYTCTYSEGGVNFVVNNVPSWAYWYGFAISNREATSFDSENYTIDQFNNAVGKAKSGKNFCVVYDEAQVIDFGKEVTVKGFYFTNDAWTVDAIVNGDNITPGSFDANDWLKCTVTPDNGNNPIDIWLAKDGDYVKDWQYIDLSSLGKVKVLSFSFDGSRKNDWGLTSPKYLCIDDMTVEFDN